MHWLIPSFSMLVLAFALDFFGKDLTKTIRVLIILGNGIDIDDLSRNANE
jgi:hypothetical protein